VVSTSPGAAAGQLDVVLETVPLLDLFARLKAEGSFTIDGAVLAELAAVPPGSPTSFAVIRQALLDDDEFMLGPFTCKKPKLSGGALTGTASVKLLPDMSFRYQFDKAENGDWANLMVKLEGKLTVKGTTTLKFAPMLVGKFSCEVELHKVPLPFGGPLAALASFKVPLGFRGEITAALQAIPLEAGFELKGESKVSLGFHYTPAGTTDLSSFTNKFEVEPKFTVPQGDLPFVIASTVSLGGTTGLDFGANFFSRSSLNLLQASLMVKTEAKLTTGKTQVDNGNFVSAYDIRPVLQAGPGKDVEKALKWLGGAVVIKQFVSVEFPFIAESPRGGMFAADKRFVLPNTSVKLTATLKPSSIKFLGLENVVDLSFWQIAPGMEPVRKETITASPGQTNFSWTWENKIIDVGTHGFFAQATSRLAPGVPIAIGLPVEVRVGRRLRWRGTATCTEMGTQTENGFTYTKASSFTVKAEHATDADAMSTGVMKITSLAASTTFTLTATSRGGTRLCPVTHNTDIADSAMTSDPNSPNSLAGLVVGEETGQYVLQTFTSGVVGTAHHIITDNYSGDPQKCKPFGTFVNNIPREFSGRWECGTPTGTFEVGADSLSGSSMATEARNVTVVGTWMFERI